MARCPLKITIQREARNRAHIEEARVEMAIGKVGGEPVAHPCGSLDLYSPNACPGGIFNERGQVAIDEPLLAELDVAVIGVKDRGVQPQAAA